MGRETVVLLNLVIAVIRKLVHAVALQAVENLYSQDKRVVFEKALLRNQTKAQIIGVVISLAFLHQQLH